MARIKHVQGNTFMLGIPLLKRTVSFSKGEKTQTDGELPPLMDGAPITVIFSRSAAVRYERTAELIEDYVWVEDKGKLPLGFYNVTVLATDSEGNPLRFKANTVLQIVDCTSEAYSCGVYWYDGFDGSQIYPVLRSNQPAIIIDGSSVTIVEGRGFSGELEDDSVTIRAIRGQSSITISSDDITITI